MCFFHAGTIFFLLSTSAECEPFIAGTVQVKHSELQFLQRPLGGSISLHLYMNFHLFNNSPV